MPDTLPQDDDDILAVMRSGNLSLLLGLFRRPVAAMGGVLDRGSLLFASLAVLAVSLALRLASPRIPFSFYSPLLVLAVIYVPGLLLLASLFGRWGGFRASFGRDYSALLTCVCMSWAAANMPLVLLAAAAPPAIFAASAAAAYLYFAALVFLAVRTVFSTGNGWALGMVMLSWLPLLLALVFWRPIAYLAGWLASPFFLFFLWYYLASDFRALGEGMRTRQRFHRMLEAAAVNPHDADAQYQLGLIHQQRRQYTEAIRRFEEAIRIDPDETDAHFQLGRIAREQNRLNDALGHFQVVVNHDEKHSSSEILRELGAVYVTAGRWEYARNELAVYVERRPYDPEGLYYYGRALEGLGETAAASRAYARAIEAARTAPRYRRSVTAPWSRQAQKQLQSMPGAAR